MAESIGTAFAVVAALITFTQTGSYISATAAGWLAEGIGFYGCMIIAELLTNHKRYAGHTFFKRLLRAAGASSANLLVEFLPAELVDSFFIRPFLMYAVPHFIKPYALGFLVGKLASDLLFYVLAIAGLEIRKRWLRR